jgi:hypothetical protein
MKILVFGGILGAVAAVAILALLLRAVLRRGSKGFAVKGWPVDIIGGARTDLMHGSWPFACLRADADSVDLRLFFRHYRLDRQDVVEFSRYRSMFTRGLRIVHRRDDLPKLLLFYSLEGYETLMQLLQKLGYTVKETYSVV